MPETAGFAGEEEKGIRGMKKKESTAMRRRLPVWNNNCRFHVRIYTPAHGTICCLSGVSRNAVQRDKATAVSCSLIFSGENSIFLILLPSHARGQVNFFTFPLGSWPEGSKGI